MAEYGVPPAELSDEDLEREGMHAHATRHWVFLHGTEEQFRTHTRRMLDLEEEYVRRHPRRTWRGAGADAAPANPPGAWLSEAERSARIHDVLQQSVAEVERLLAMPTSPDASAEADESAVASVLAEFEQAGGALHKLEAHQAARRAGLDHPRLATLYRRDPALLVAQGDQRVLTDAGRQWLSTRSVVSG
jgi:Family of unknown function (DUF6158)